MLHAAGLPGHPKVVQGWDSTQGQICTGTLRGVRSCALTLFPVGSSSAIAGAPSPCLQPRCARARCACGCCPSPTPSPTPTPSPKGPHDSPHAVPIPHTLSPPRGPRSGGVVAVERLLTDVWAGLPGADALLCLLSIRDAVQWAAEGDTHLQQHGHLPRYGALGRGGHAGMGTAALCVCGKWGERGCGFVQLISPSSHLPWGTEPGERCAWGTVQCVRPKAWGWGREATGS